MNESQKIAQYVIDNRFAKSEKEKVSDVEIFNNIVDMVNEHSDQFKPKWISTNDESPVERSIVDILLIESDERVIDVLYEAGMYHGNNGDFYSEGDVLCWISIPPTPYEK